MIAKLKQSYAKPEEIEGYDELKPAEQEKVTRAWEEGAIPEDDKGPGEPVPSEKKKKAPAKRARKPKVRVLMVTVTCALTVVCRMRMTRMTRTSPS